MFAEPVQLIAGRRNPSPDLYAKQIAGQPIPDLENLPGAANVAQMAAWDGYKLTQIARRLLHHSEAHQSAERLDRCSFRRARRSGLAFVGDTSRRPRRRA